VAINRPDPQEIPMPLVTLSVVHPKSPEFKDSVLEAVHGALVSIGVPEADRFHRVLELSPADFRFDATYPDVQGKRTDDFVLIEIVLSAGRSVKVKKQFLANLMTGLAAAGHNPENAMVVFKETTWENWAFAGGRQIHV
jgi:phenylpyruvate tautomerase PptA (4-oxalocrotonate tautomerase family)